MRTHRVTARYASGTCAKCGETFFRGSTMVYVDSRRYCLPCGKPIEARARGEESAQEEAKKAAHAHALRAGLPPDGD